MKFTKMQGTGNDFILVDARGSRRDWSKLAVAMCDRHYGVGGDGILLLLPSNKAEFRMRIFNSDGSEADACGNGTRCIVKYFFDSGLAAQDAREVTVETRKGIRRAVVNKRVDKVVKVTVGMGEPKFKADEIPVVIGQGNGKVGPMLTYTVDVDGKKLELNLVSMGNPHAVYFTNDRVVDFPLSNLGPEIEHHKIFPDRVNFEVARVLDSGHIDARVWERGAGETLACGSGACAITVAARLHSYVKDKAAIKLPGGVLDLEWDSGAGEVFLSGPAETVFTGEWPDK